MYQARYVQSLIDYKYLAAPFGIRLKKYTISIYSVNYVEVILLFYKSQGSLPAGDKDYIFPSTKCHNLQIAPFINNKS